ncbi:MAG: hypothetical protein HY606_04610 [Planctomycetes bacterium]|nr:hypothetical protein [Planctomycetota bacterium]
MKSNLIFDKAYKVWLADIKARVRNAPIRLSHSLPKSLKSSLPTIEEIEKEFSKDIGKAKK